MVVNLIGMINLYFFSPFREYMCDLELQKKVLEDSQTKQVLQYYYC